MAIIEKTGLKNLNSGLIFFVLTILLLIPLLKFDYLFTHDGPAHIYNACLIHEIISGNDLCNYFLHLKSFPEPNWTGHFILCFLTFFVKPNIAEKIFLGGYIILLPYFFRSLLKKINPDSGYVSLLIFPFVYSYFFFGGLYNFLSGVTLLFAALANVLPAMSEERKTRYRNILIFSVLLYLSHLVALCVFIFIVFVAQLFSYKKNLVTEKKTTLIDFIKYSRKLIIAFLPSLILLAIFFSDKLQLTSGSSGMSFPEMLDSLLFINPIITLQYETENIYSLIVFLTISALLINWIFLLIKSGGKNANNDIAFYRKPLFWIISSLFMLICYLLIPDQAASGGVVKFRLELFFFLFLIVLISTLSIKKKVSFALAILVSGWIIFKLIYFYPLMKNLNEDTKTVMHCTDHMKENSILLPLNYSSNWMHCNIFNYAGTVKNIFVLDNYEAGMPHFPIEWKKDRNPVAILGNFNIDPPPLCANVNAFEKQTQHLINYIAVWKYQTLTDSCTKNIFSEIADKYHLIYSENESLQLYERN